MNVLVIYSHSYQDQSVANAAIIDVLAKQPNYHIRNLEKLYPDGTIDVEAEQERLLWADVVVLQHPLFWYNVPPMMRKWMDEVFAFGFAYGDGGDKLKGKRLVQSFTGAASTEEFTPEMLVASTAHLKMACGFCSLTYAGYVHSLSMLSFTNPNCLEHAQKHAKRLIEHIDSIKA